jgi:ATP-binding cassette subfamily B (MDR/TAP) protein 1
LSTVNNCDKIAVINKGVLAEEGTYDELINKEGGNFQAIAKGL